MGHKLWLFGSIIHKFGYCDVVLVILTEEIYCDPQKEDQVLPTITIKVYHSLAFTCFLDGLLIGVQLCSIFQGVCYL